MADWLVSTFTPVCLFSVSQSGSRVFLSKVVLFRDQGRSRPVFYQEPMTTHLFPTKCKWLIDWFPSLDLLANAHAHRKCLDSSHKIQCPPQIYTEVCFASTLTPLPIKHPHFSTCHPLYPLTRHFPQNGRGLSNNASLWCLHLRGLMKQ